MSSRRLISVVVPVLNEEENIQPFYDAAVDATRDLTDFDWEFIFVDDGSTDRTAACILALRERDPRVRILQLSRNFGSYGALRAGLDYARGDAVITISVDLQDPPELFRSFVALWQEGNQIVWGARVQRDDPWTKKALASLFYALLRRLALTDLPTAGMDCGLFDRVVVNAFQQIADKNAITFMTIYWMGLQQARVPYHRQRRQLGTSKWPVGKRMKSALDVITSFSYLPIRMASYLGLTISILSLLAAILVLLNRLVFGFGELGWGWPSLIITMLFLGGVQLVMLGIIGEYLWRISSQVRGHPQYIVMRQVGFEEPSEKRVSAVSQWATPGGCG